MTVRRFDLNVDRCPPFVAVLTADATLASRTVSPFDMLVNVTRLADQKATTRVHSNLIDTRPSSMCSWIASCG